MCGRFSLHKIIELSERFRLNKIASQIAPSYNIAPSQDVFAIVSNNQLVQLRWGLVPHWSKEATAKKGIINARAETVDKKPAFKRSFKYKRCLIPADGFYEWKRTGMKKVPYRITLKNGELFGFAGLWDSWVAPEGGVLNTCTIITTTANSLVETIHGRMPVILPREVEDTWLDPEITDSRLLKSLLKPFPANLMQAYKISGLVNSPYNNEAKILDAVSGND